MSGLTVKYKGSQIASLDSSGTKTLSTSGKYLEDDVVIQFEGGGEGGSGGAYNAESIILDDGTQKIRIVDAEGGGCAPEEPAIVQYPKNEVNYYDIYGNRVFSQTYDEALANPSPPYPPTPEGLSNPTWRYGNNTWVNYAKKYHFESIPVVPSYNITDGNFHIFIDNRNTTKLHPAIRLRVNGTLSVDWGDGSITTITGYDAINTIVYTDHEYSVGGKYEIIISPVGTLSSGVRFAGGAADSDIHAMSGLFTEYERAIGRRPYLYDSDYLKQIYKLYIPGWVNNTTGNYYYSLAGLDLDAVVFDISNKVDATYHFSQYMFYGTNLRVFPYPTGSYSYYAGVFLNSRINIISFGLYWTQMAKGCRFLEEYIQDVTRTTIKAGLFYGAKSINRAIISEKVTTIEDEAFREAIGIEDIYFFGTTPPTIASSAFSGLRSSTVIHVPVGCIDAYKATTNFPTSYTVVDDLEDVTAV